MWGRSRRQSFTPSWDQTRNLKLSGIALSMRQLVRARSQRGTPHGSMGPEARQASTTQPATLSTSTRIKHLTMLPIQDRSTNNRTPSLSNRWDRTLNDLLPIETRKITPIAFGPSNHRSMMARLNCRDPINRLIAWPAAATPAPRPSIHMVRSPSELLDHSWRSSNLCVVQTP